MDKREPKKFEILLAVRSICMMLSLAFFDDNAEKRWAVNQIIEQILNSFATYIFILFLSSKYEGLRNSLLISLLPEILMQFLQLEESGQTNFITAPILMKGSYLLALALISVQIFMYFTYPCFYTLPLTGSKQVGYVLRSISSIPVAIFYPTDDEFNNQLNPPLFYKEDKILTDSKIEHQSFFCGIKRYLEETAYLTSRFPKEFGAQHVPLTLLKIGFQGIFHGRKLDVKTEAALSVPADREIPVMVFSHGLGSHPHLHAGLCRDLASKGVVVLAPMHSDVKHIKQFYNEVQDSTEDDNLTQFQNAMKYALNFRIQEVNTVVNLASQNQSDFCTYFPNFVNEKKKENLPKFRQSIIIGGHSFGGETAMRVSLENQNTYSTILFDPTMASFDENLTLLEKQYDKPALILCSQDFHVRMPFFSQRDYIQKLILSNKTYEKKKNSKRENIFAGQIMKFGHSSFCDIALYAPRELLNMRKDIIDESCSGTHLMMINKLVEYFIQAAHQNLAKSDNSTPTQKSVPSLKQIEEKFKELCPVLGKKESPLYLFDK